MPAKYHPVSPAIWDRRFRQLSQEAKIVAFYLWTSPTRCSEGLFRIPLAYIVGDTALETDRVLGALRELQQVGLFDYDEDSETVLDRVALKYNPIRNGADKETGEVSINKRLPGALKQLESLTDSPLLQPFAELASRLSPDFGFAIYEKYPYLRAPSEPLGSPLEAPNKGGEREREEKEQLRDGVEKEIETEVEVRGPEDVEGFEAFKAARRRLMETFSADVVEERVR